MGRVWLAIATIGIGSAVACAPVVVEHVAKGRAGRAGIELTVGDVGFGLGDVRSDGLFVATLRDVTAKKHGLDAKIDEVVVHASWTGVRWIHVRNAQVAMTQVPRLSGGRENRGGGAGAGPNIRFENVNLDFDDGSRRASVRNARGTRSLASADAASFEIDGIAVEADDPVVRTDGHTHLSASVVRAQVRSRNRSSTRTSSASDDGPGAAIPVGMSVGTAEIVWEGRTISADGVEGSVSVGKNIVGVVEAESTFLGEYATGAVFAHGAMDDGVAWVEATATGLNGTGAWVSGSAEAGDEESAEAVLYGQDDRVAEAKAVRGPSGHHVKVDVTSARCDELMALVPSKVAETLGGVSSQGVVSIHLDVRTGDAVSVSLEVPSMCRIRVLGDGFSIAALRKPFSRTVLTADGKPRREESGPGTPFWVPVGSMSRFLVPSVITMEDMNFLGHRGLDVSAIRNSIRINLEEGRFARGASTITMQLAKNLWLGREKSVERKMKEAALALHLENGMTKEEIVELYLNVVEFWPGEYGIARAARRFFGTDPAALTLSQSLMLASMLPRPTDDPFDGGGPVRAGRMKLVGHAMRAMEARGFITGEDLLEGMDETPVWGSPSPAHATVPLLD